MVLPDGLQIIRDSIDGQWCGRAKSIKKMYIKKIRNNIKRDGLRKTIWLCLRYPISKVREIRRVRRKRLFESEVLSVDSAEYRFTWIYEQNKWGDKESVSGPGSTLEHTANLRAELPALFQKYSIQSAFDAPCGDFHWMKHVVAETDISYTGADIVEPLIQRNQAEYARKNVGFRKINLIEDPLPVADLMLCRDCLFHFSHEDTIRALQNFLRSEIKFLLTTSYVLGAEEKNKDIQTGQFRPLDLRSEPYSFPEPLHSIPDWIGANRQRFLHLWSREQLVESMEHFGTIDTPAMKKQ